MLPMRRILMGLVACVFLLQVPRGTAASPGLAEPEIGFQADHTLAIVVNQTNSIEDLSFPELRRIFLGERSHWPNGRRITLVMMETGTAERKAMLHDVYHMSEEDLNRHFLRGLFTGEVFASPKTLATSVGVRKFVFNVPGAIGYMLLSDVDTSVKVVKVDGRLPSDKEYQLAMDPHPVK
jgi:ABC-type phosphate transport system substrate-binding protein